MRRTVIKIGMEISGGDTNEDWRRAPLNASRAGSDSDSREVCGFALPNSSVFSCRLSVWFTETRASTLDHLGRFDTPKNVEHLPIESSKSNTKSLSLKLDPMIHSNIRNDLCDPPDH